MSDAEFEKLGLDPWLYLSCFDDEGEILHTSEFGKTTDDIWYWSNPSRIEEKESPQITLWSKNYIESRDEWVFRGAFHSTIRSDIYSEEHLIDCFKDFLNLGWPEKDYFGLKTTLTQEHQRFEDIEYGGFGADLTWRFKWTSFQKRDLANELGQFSTSELFANQEHDFDDEWDL